jgi:hypothetical protein
VIALAEGSPERHAAVAALHELGRVNFLPDPSTQPCMTPAEPVTDRA